MSTKSLRKGVLLAAGLLAISVSPMLASAAPIPQDAGQTQTAPADQGKRARPDLKIVIASGYSSESASEGVPPDAVFLQKPFDLVQLRRALGIG